MTGAAGSWKDVRMAGRRSTGRIGRWVCVGLLLVMATSCGGDGSDEDGTVGGTPGATDAVQEQPAQQSPDDGGGTQQVAGVCAVVQSVDLEDAFAGTLEFGVPQERSEVACVVPVEGAEGEGLIVQVTSPGNYQAKAGFEDQESVPFERIDGLGQEAFLANEADLNVLVDDDTALSAGISAIFMEENQRPEADVLKAGLTELAQALLATL